MMRDCGADQRLSPELGRVSSQKTHANGKGVHRDSAGTNLLDRKRDGSVSGTLTIALTEKSLPSNVSNGRQELNGVMMPSIDKTNSIDSFTYTETSAAALKSALVPLPHFISGDFDSIEPDVLEHYTDLGVEIVPTPDQDETDFTKALRQLDKHLAETSQLVHHVLAAVSISHDRFDHVLANINTLHMSPLSVPVVLVSPSSVLLLLRGGRHELCTPRYPAPHLNWCAYAPCAGPATVTTSGLKWDVSNTLVQFGGLVSTSNQFAEDCSSAFIETDQPLLFMFNRPPDDSIGEGAGAAVQASTAELNGKAVLHPVSDT